MRRVVACIIVCVFGFLACTVDSQGTRAGNSGGSSGFDGGGAGTSSGGGSCFPGSGQKFCGNSCPPTDALHGCDGSSCAPCNSTNGTPTCVDGQCSVTCSTGFADCDKNSSNGCEVDTQTDAYNCGGCNHNCFDDPSADNWACVDGTCTPSKCKFGEADCNGDNTCDVNLTTDSNNCGTCGNVCRLPHTQTAVCQPSTLPPPNPPGTCVISKCEDHYKDCNQNPTDGCETGVTTALGDPNNCGDCGKQCSQNHVQLAACVSGTCVLTCAQGWGDCDHNLDNGCETPLDTTNNCGACGVQCTNPNGTTTCTAGKCDPSCKSGFDNCDGNLDNGCETPLNTTNDCRVCDNSCPSPPANATESCSPTAGCIFTCDAQLHRCGNACFPDSDPSHCGGSCTDCPAPSGGTPECVSGSCSFTCDPGYHQCGQLCALNSDPSYCGRSCTSCPLPAPGTGSATCVSGTCGVTCNFGYHTCGTQTQCYSGTDPNHCGDNSSCVKCPVPTNGQATCNNGTCGIACNTGYHTCGQNQCYSNSDTANCGNDTKCVQCGTQHTTSVQCTSGQCVLTCDATHADCDGDPTNGCEGSNSNNDCCGVKCTGSTNCVNGTCT